MEDSRRVVISRLYEILQKKGFKTSSPDLGGMVSFDLIARRDEEKYVIKVLYNVDTFRKINANELIRISRVTSSAALVVGERAGNGRLERDVVYYRHKVPIVSFETFIDYLEGEQPYVYSGPGGFYVGIDGQKMHKIREERGYSIGYVSNKIGTSRRSVSLYEAGSAATIEIFMKLQEILGEDIINAIDLFNIASDINTEDDCFEPLEGFIGEVFNIMMRTGYDFYSMKKSPFDAIAQDSLETLFLMGLFEDIGVRAQRINAIKNISEVFENDALIVSRMNTDKDTIGGCPIINLSDLRRAVNKEDLVRLVEKKKSII